MRMPAKILHIIAHLGLGGAQTVVKGIFEEQQSHKDIFVFALRKREVTTEIRHTNVIHYNSISKYSLAPLRSLKKLIQQEQINILHCHLFRAQVFGFILKKLFFPRLYLIFHEHGAIMGSDTNNIIQDMCYKFFIKQSVSEVDKYITASRATQDTLLRKGKIPLEKTLVLYNFVDRHVYNVKNVTSATKIGRECGVQPDDFVVGFAGRIVARKGWREYLHTARVLSNSIPNIKFCIAGTGPEKPDLIASITRDCLQEKVVVLGYITDMLSFYSSIDCLVMPSQWEPMGIAAIEALACGVPVIAADVPGLNEVIHHNVNGLLFNTGKKQDLAEKIQQVYQKSNKRQHLVTNGLDSIKQYSIEHFLEELDAIYDRRSE